MSGGGGGIVPAAIISRHRIDYRDVPSQGSVAPTTIEVGSSSVPLNILFRSSSSNINVQQAHEGAGGTSQQSSSVDEPHHLFHEVSKPIIQEVREVISPYRRIIQEINPVQEDIQTIVARGTGGGAGVIGGGGFGGAGFGGAGFGEQDLEVVLVAKVVVLVDMVVDMAVMAVEEPEVVMVAAKRLIRAQGKYRFGTTNLITFLLSR